jgi:hypothetical protein
MMPLLSWVGWCYQRCSTLSRAPSTDLNSEVVCGCWLATGRAYWYDTHTALRLGGGSIEMSGRRSLGGLWERKIVYSPSKFLRDVAYCTMLRAFNGNAAAGRRYLYSTPAICVARPSKYVRYVLQNAYIAMTTYLKRANNGTYNCMDKYVHKTSDCRPVKRKN